MIDRSPTTEQQPDEAAVPERSARPVVEFALVESGYSPDTARTLVDRLIEEGRNE